MNPCGLKRIIIAPFKMAAVRCHGNGPNSNRKEITEGEEPRGEEEHPGPERRCFITAPRPAAPPHAGRSVCVAGGEPGCLLRR